MHDNNVLLILTTAWRASSRFSSAPALPPGFLPLAAAPLAPFWDMAGDVEAVEIFLVTETEIDQQRAGRSQVEMHVMVQAECVALQPRVSQHPKGGQKVRWGRAVIPAMAGVMELQANHVGIAFLSLARAVSALRSRSRSGAL